MFIKNVKLFLLLLLFLMVSIRPVDASVLRVSNNIIAVQVNAMTGDAKGRFNIGTANGKTLLYQYPNDPNSSHFNVKIDDVIYSNDRRTGAEFLTFGSDPEKKLNNTAIWCSWFAGNVEIEQRLSVEQYSDQTGAVFIQYVVTNHDTKSHKIGLLLEMDTMIGSNDSARVSTSFGYTDVEKKFEAPNIPTYFQAFEISPVIPGLVAQGSLIGYNAVSPDLFIVGTYQNLSTVKWDYEPTGERYKDSAVILRWNSVTVNTGESCTFSTYYGVGDVDVVAGELSLNLSAPSELQCINRILTPNPFDVNLIVTNTGYLVAGDIQAQIQLPAEMFLYPGENATRILNPSSLSPQQSGNVSWRVYATPVANDTTLTINVNVTSSNVPSNSGQRSIRVQAYQEALRDFSIIVTPARQDILAGQEVNFSITIRPGSNFSDPIILSIWPLVEGVVSTILPQVINPDQTASLKLQTTTNLTSGVYTFAISGTSNDVIRTALAAIQVQSTAIEDTSPPFTSDHYPAKGASNVPLDSPVIVHLQDNFAGVDRNQIIMKINDQNISPEITGDKLDYMLRYQPSKGWVYNANIHVLLQARDLATPPNIMPDESYSFFVVQDTLAPFITDLNPVRNARNVAINTPLLVHVRDDLSGVDKNSIRMKVNGTVVTPAISGNMLDYTLTYTPIETFAFNQEVQVTLNANDLSSPPNVMSTAQYHFFTGHVLPDITVANLSLSENELVVNELYRCAAEISDANVSIHEPFQIVFLLDGVVIKDTLITKIDKDQSISVDADLKCSSAGYHVIEVAVDYENAIAEISEINNSIRLGFQVNSAKVIVRPNPFTPNRDGFNDEVHFRFAGLKLNTPQLQIFNLKGEAILILKQPMGTLFNWDGKDQDGRELKPGIYIYLLQDGSKEIASGTVVLAR